MAIVRNIGKNTLGDNDKMSVAMRDYEMSNHNLSFIFRNTQSSGTLVPCMKIVAQKGDVFDIEMFNKTLTHPTVGPLFGSYKLQHFIFSCPIRLYNSWLHNNRLGIGMKMSQIKLPMMKITTPSPNEDKLIKTDPSSLCSYMGFKGRRSRGNTSLCNVNALPFLMYGDIFKNYFANKQEKKFYYIGVADTVRTLIFDSGKGDPTEWTVDYPQRRQTLSNNSYVKINYFEGQDPKQIWKGLSLVSGGREYPLTSLTTSTLTGNIITLGKVEEVIGTNMEVSKFVHNEYANGIKLKTSELELFDEIRDKILQSPGNTVFDCRYRSYKGNYFYDIVADYANPQAGLLVKTYDSDVFQNWVNTEWIDGSNGINEISAVDVSDGKLTMDSLNLAQKVYNMLNRIAVSGGTYRDWLETVYTSGSYIERPETPVFEGGMSQYIEFDEVVSQSATEDEPLGTLAGRGKNTEQLGSGKLHFKVSEPSYIIGLCAITPQIDYSQGNDWDMIGLETLDDFHKPALDGIGYQDSINGERAWWTTYIKDSKIINTSAGKTVAWINYMTNFNKTFGNFASGQSESFMVLNRNYEMAEDYSIEDLTTYIDPSKHNEIFADTNIDAMNFWVQTAFKIQVRRNISAKQIPNL